MLELKEGTNMTGRALIKLSKKIKVNKIKETKVKKEPKLETIFQVEKRSGKSEYRRGIPPNPSICWGKNVIFTPKNITKKWGIRSSSFIVRPLIKGYQ